jgi:acyl-CoA thioester hydrolase
MSKPFTQLLRVRYAECDAQNVVFNARYVEYVDVAFTEFTRAVWGGYEKIIERGLDSQVVNMTVDWVSSATFDDVLDIAVECDHIGNTSYSMTFDIRVRDTGQEIAKARAVYVMVSATEHQKCLIPDDLKEALRMGAPGVVADQAG